MAMRYGPSRNGRYGAVASSTGMAATTAGRPPLVNRDLGGVDHRGPARDVLVEELGEVRAGAADRRGADLGQALAQLGLLEHRVGLGVEALDDLGRRAGRQEQAVPAARLVARQHFA